MYEQTYELDDPTQNSKLGPQEASNGLKMAKIDGFEPSTPSEMLLWVEQGGTSPPKPISIMDLGLWVHMDPSNTFLPPLEASRGLKISSN